MNKILQQFVMLTLTRIERNNIQYTHGFRHECQHLQHLQYLNNEK